MTAEACDTLQLTRTLLLSADKGTERTLTRKLCEVMQGTARRLRGIDDQHYERSIAVADVSVHPSLIGDRLFRRDRRFVLPGRDGRPAWFADRRTRSYNWPVTQPRREDKTK